MTPPAVAPPDAFRDRSILVTGAGHPGQLAETVGKAFAARGARVILTGRRQDLLDARVADLAADGLRATAAAADLADPGQVDALHESVAEVSAGGLHGLVNVAGGFAAGPLAGTSPDAWARMFEINVTTAFNVTRAFLPMLRAACGSIVFFSSAAALPGASTKGMAAYVSAKSALLALMRSVAAEERDAGVRANAVAPTSIRTTSNLESMGETGTYVDRETVADWVMWLTSPTSGPVTGQVFRLG